MKNQLTKIIFIFLIVCSLPETAESLFPQNKTKYIRNIEIERQDVFPVITGKPRFLYQWANSLHIVTKESVVRKELLFKSGDVFDAELLEESERKLRRLAFFGEAKITMKQELQDSVDISVVTQDQWSTLPSTIIQQGGGRTVLGGTLEEFNFLGYGKQIYSEIQHENDVGTQFAVRYTDLQLFFSRWTSQTAFVTGPLLKSFSAQIVRPFYSLDTRWSGGITGLTRDATVRIFEASQETNRYLSEIDEIRLFGAMALGQRFSKTRLQLTYRFAERNFSPIESGTTNLDDLPDDELIHSLTARLSFENLHYAKEKQMDKFIRTEDLTLGNFTSISFGRTGIPFPTGVKRFEVNLFRREAHEIFNKQYLFALFSFRTLFEKNTIAAVRLQYYNKLFKHQTFAMNFALDYGIDMETTRPFLLGGDSGLRGYKAREFSGNRRILVNIEDRIFTSLNIFTVAFGGVLFFDAGHVWPEGDSIRFSNLNYSVGLGLRLGYTKSPRSRVGRVDFAWPLNRGGGFGISVGVEQQFSIN